MKLDPRLAEILGRQPKEEQTLAEKRARQNDVAARLRGKITPAVPDSVILEDRTVPGRTHPIPVLIQRPKGLPNPAPVLVWAHGGAFVHGSPRTVLSRTASIAQRAGVCVVSVDYRLLPEHNYPENLHDVVDVVRWVAKTGLDKGFDTSRILVGGDSAGGNLAAATGIMCRDEGNPAILGQILEVPILDLSDTSEAMAEARRDAPDLAAALHHSHVRYLSHGASLDNPLTNPACLENAHGLPPTFLLNCEVDPLRDDSIAWQHKLQDAGVPVELTTVRGMDHGTQSFTLAFPQARDAEHCGRNPAVHRETGGAHGDVHGPRDRLAVRAGQVQLEVGFPGTVRQVGRHLHRHGSARWDAQHAGRVQLGVVRAGDADGGLYRQRQPVLRHDEQRAALVDDGGLLLRIQTQGQISHGRNCTNATDTTRAGVRTGIIGSHE